MKQWQNDHWDIMQDYTDAINIIMQSLQGL